MAIYQSRYTGKDIDKVVGELGNDLIEGEGEHSLVQTNNKVLQGDINDQNQLNAILKQEKNRAIGNYSTALGYQTNTGCLVYRIYEIDYTSAPGYYILTIGDDSQVKPAYRGEDNETDNQKYYREKDIVTIRLDGNYDEISAIETIENNQIKVKSFPVLAKDSEDGKSQSLKPKLCASSGGDINSLRVNKKRNGGYISIGSSCSVAMGYQSIAGGGYSYAEGLRAQAMGKYAHAEGKDTQALAYASHSEGSENQVTGSQSHVEGARNVVTGFSAHAEGEGTKASGNKSHAEGAGVMNANGTQVVKYLEAKGTGSHAEGYSTLAEGHYSHAQGIGTIANAEAQHVEGKYNQPDSNMAHIVGNGKKDSLSNAHTLDWDGNAWFAGKVQVGDNKVDLIDSNELNRQLDEVDEQTKQYLYDLDYTFVQATKYENDLKLGLAKDSGVEFNKIDNKWGYKVITSSGKKIIFDNPINITNSNKIGAWIYYSGATMATITFEFNSKGGQEDNSDIEFKPTLKQGWNYYIYDFNCSYTERTGKINNVYGYSSKRGTIETLDLTNLNYFRIMEMSNAFTNGTIYIGRVAVLTPEENQAIENTLRLQAIVEGAGTNFDTLKEIETEFNSLSRTATGLSDEIDELEASVKELQETGVEVELTQDQVDSIIEQIGTEGLQISSMENSTITTWFNFAQ